MTATDADGGSFGSVTYSLGSGINSAVPSHFTIGKETGQICTSGVLDRDQGPASFDFTVTAVDGVSHCVLKSGLMHVNTAAMLFIQTGEQSRDQLCRKAFEQPSKK